MSWPLRATSVSLPSEELTCEVQVAEVRLLPPDAVGGVGGLLGVSRCTVEVHVVDRVVLLLYRSCRYKTIAKR